MARGLWLVARCPLEMLHLPSWCPKATNAPYLRLFSAKLTLELLTWIQHVSNLRRVLLLFESYVGTQENKDRKDDALSRGTLDGRDEGDTGFVC